MSNPFTLYNLDAVDFLRDLPDASIDLVITDPPYESLEKHRKIGTTTRLKHSKGSSNDWFQIFPNARFSELFGEVFRVLKKNSHFYMHCDHETMFHAVPIAKNAGFRFWKPLVWDKVSIGMGYHYRCRHEYILFFEKGKRKLQDLGMADVFTEKLIRNGYPTEKPSPLSFKLISQSTSPGDLVCDPFMGAGSVGFSALDAGRQFIGNDLSTGAVDLTRTKLLTLLEAKGVV